MAEVGDTNTSGKVEQPSAILELDPRSLAPDHHRITGDPSEPLCNMLCADLLQVSGSRHKPGGVVGKQGTLGKAWAIYTDLC
jgi:hypothetical protein